MGGGRAEKMGLWADLRVCVGAYMMNLGLLCTWLAGFPAPRTLSISAQSFRKLVAPHVACLRPMVVWISPPLPPNLSLHLHLPEACTPTHTRPSPLLTFTGPEGAVSLGWPAREGVGLPVVRAGAPPPGLSFLQWAVDVGGLRPAPVSLPRIATATRGLPLLPNHPVFKVLHVGCGDGGLTRMIASQGLQVLGTDVDVSAAAKRGLVTVPLAPRPAGTPPTAPCIKATLAQVSGWEEGARFDSIVVQQGGSGAGVGGDASSSVAWMAPGAMQEVRDLLAPDGRLCAELALLPSPRVHPAAIINAVNASGMTVVAWQVVRAAAVSPGQATAGGSCTAGASGGSGVNSTPEFMRLVARPTC